MQLLYFVNGSDGDCGVSGQRQAVLVVFSVEGTHVLDLLEVDITEDKLLVAAVDDGGSVAAGEHVAHGPGPELSEDGGLGAQHYSLLVSKLA